jgi:hypothetical protein
VLTIAEAMVQKDKTKAAEDLKSSSKSANPSSKARQPKAND